MVSLFLLPFACVQQVRRRPCNTSTEHCMSEELVMQRRAEQQVSITLHRFLFVISYLVLRHPRVRAFHRPSAPCWLSPTQ